MSAGVAPLEQAERRARELEMRLREQARREGAEKLAGEIREAVTRVVRDLRLGESGYSLAGAAWNLNRRWKVQQAEDFAQGFIDTLVLAVDQVLAREGE